MSSTNRIIQPKSPEQGALDFSTALRVPSATRQMSVGLLGGSFNPPHSGHRHISLFALHRLNLDRIWWLVSPGNPLKDTTNLQSLESRVALSRSLADHPRLEITAFEACLSSVYTIDTMRFLRRRYSGTRFVWLMGADSMIGIHKWRNWRSLFKLMPIVVLDRPDCRYQAMASKAAQTFLKYYIRNPNLSTFASSHPPKWTYLTIPLSGESSTILRKKRNNHFNVASLS